ncbi:TPA: hypothetical protein MXD50_003795 [Klebsiella pneumoniae]|uniref:hypothetical protein n=1 Tax=Klebsiella pneumoniae TaxID=573 RepID=UPI001B9EA646|nr:hypothetical protein [Klebsiella pneumoniae]EIY2249775.1 hypothetical protein [Klebsiella pneumoniae]EKV5872430.1 hypothetical protein [Klebsiella pneumoniae]MBR8599310.1 hypothetical protein [Klebsiella pneumoniae subsp. pneumoniae]HBT4975631.1 hypothetical protein [Klebsiella pneumoniae]HCM6193128.1 hypothetical protein [Klebsiella pneumoniae]
MTFWNDSYQSELNSIDLWIEKNIRYNDVIPGDISRLGDDEFIESVLFLTWDYFRSLFTYQRDSLNKYTQFNQRHLKERAIPRLDKLESNRFYFLNNLIRIMYEHYFWTQNATMPPVFVNTRTLDRLDQLSLSSDRDAQFLWIERSMPAALTMSIMASEEFVTLKEMANDVTGYEEKFSQQINTGTQKAVEKINEISVNIDELITKAKDSQKDISEYVKKLNNFKSEFNFVLLSKAFSNLRDKKKKEYNINNLIVIFFSIFLVFIPLMALMNHIVSWYPVELNLSALSYYLPILSLELLMFYFMRLYYIEGKSIKAQMLQIDQRLSLCEFIHDYVETKNNSGTEKESWSLFEKLIFSPIQVTSENIPSLLDGASSIAELAGKVLSRDSK